MFAISFLEKLTKKFVHENCAKRREDLFVFSTERFNVRLIVGFEAIENAGKFERERL